MASEISEYARDVAQFLDQRILNNDGIALRYIVICLYDKFRYLDEETARRLALAAIADERKRRNKQSQ